MTSILEALHRLLTGRNEESIPVGYTYRIFWTSQVRHWKVERLVAVYAALLDQLESSAIDVGEERKIHQIPEIGTGSHAGVSLQALSEVLKAFLQERT